MFVLGKSMIDPQSSNVTIIYGRPQIVFYTKIFYCLELNSEKNTFYGCTLVVSNIIWEIKRTNFGLSRYYPLLAGALNPGV